jgi:hypothetical protein
MAPNWCIGRFNMKTTIPISLKRSIIRFRVLESPYSQKGLDNYRKPRHSLDIATRNFEMDLTRCTFAYPGTFGHECDAPATLAGSKPSDLTVSSVYFTRRCAECAAVKGGENVGVARWVPFDAAAHRNVFKP